MLLRICLIVTILAGAGVIALSHFKVRPHVQGIIDEREKNAKDRDTEKSAKVKAQTELKATKIELATTKTTLEATDKQLTDTKGQLVSETKRANDFKEKFNKITLDFTEARQELDRWKQIPLDPSQVKDLIASEKNLKANNDVLKEELKILTKVNARLTNTINQLVGVGEIDPPLPAGLRGKVLVVDPKWNFVVLDIGEKQGLVQRGVLMVSRNSRLVAKVRVTNVQAEKSIANIMPGWKLGEVMEGDEVLY